MFVMKVTINYNFPQFSPYNRTPVLEKTTTTALWPKRTLAASEEYTTYTISVAGRITTDT